MTREAVSYLINRRRRRHASSSSVGRSAGVALAAIGEGRSRMNGICGHELIDEEPDLVYFEPKWLLKSMKNRCQNSCLKKL